MKCSRNLIDWDKEARHRQASEDFVPLYLPEFGCFQPRKQLSGCQLTSAEKVWIASRKEGRIARTVVLKLKTSEFNILTRSHTPSLPPDSCETFTAIALSLRERVDLGTSQRFRLVGVCLSNFQDAEESQSALFTSLAHSGS